ncbi:MAG: ABC transporter permease [Betaproteobacteria bacterium]|nr:ABC transporter permease [Betaproteobacteria bacterium]
MIWRHRWLLWSFARREILNRYAGSAAGIAWALAHPLALLAVYAFVFTGVFRVKLPPEIGTAGYTAFVAVTLWPWLMFADGLDRGMASVQENAGLIRKVAFPHQLVVHAAVLASFAVHVAGYLAVLLVLRLAGEPLHLSGLPWAFVLLLLLAMGTTGLAAVLATLQTLLRDVKQVVGVAITLLFYATPILYPASLVPAALKPVIGLNPLAWIVERLREVLLTGAGPSPLDLAIALGSALTLAAGLAFFERVSPYFEDFL